MIRHFKYTFLVGIGVLMLGVATPVLAHDGGDIATVKENEIENHLPGHRGELSADMRLKFCQMREKSINNIMQRIAQRGTRHIAVINKIAERTEAFYVKSGKTLANYDELVADANAKKADAEATVQAVKDSSVTFKCDGTDPKGAAALFQNHLKDEIKALKAYKTAVKDLIVGVKSVQGTDSADSNTEGSQ